MTPVQLPEVPEPEFPAVWAGIPRRAAGYTAAQLREYATEAVMAERESFRELIEAVYAEFCGPGTESIEPDDSKVSYPEDRCHITFGMIRRARARLTQSETNSGR